MEWSKKRGDLAALLHCLQGKAGAFPDVQHVIALSKLKWLFCTFSQVEHWQMDFK